jgi:hypothetical protein
VAAACVEHDDRDEQCDTDDDGLRHNAWYRQLAAFRVTNESHWCEASAPATCGWNPRLSSQNRHTQRLVSDTVFCAEQSGLEFVRPTVSFLPRDGVVTPRRVCGNDAIGTMRDYARANLARRIAVATVP